MVTIRLPGVNRWRRQPQGPIEIDNTYASPAKTVVMMGGSGYTFTTGSSSVVATIDGMADRFNGTSDYRELISDAGFSLPATTVVIRFATVNNPGSSNYGCVVGRHYGGELLWNHVSEPDSRGALHWFSGGAWSAVQLPSEYRVGNRWMTVAYSIEESKKSIGYVDGIKFCDVSVSTFDATSFPFYAGRLAYGGVNGYLDVDISLVYVTHRILPEQQLAELSCNPWQLFKARPSRFYLLPVSGQAQGQPASKRAGGIPYGRGDYSITRGYW